MDGTQLLLEVATVALMCVNVLLLLWLPVYVSRKLSQRELTTSKTYDVHVDATSVLKEMDLSAVEKDARDKLFQTAEAAAKRLKESLENTVDQLASNINDMTSTQLAQEFEKYQVSLQALRDQSINEFGDIQKELQHRRAELLDQLERSVAKEQAKRVDQLADRLNDVVASYLTETLGNQVDLGAQATYIFSQLQAHKDDIKRDILA